MPGTTSEPPLQALPGGLHRQTRGHPRPREREGPAPTGVGRMERSGRFAVQTPRGRPSRVHRAVELHLGSANRAAAGAPGRGVAPRVRQLSLPRCTGPGVCTSGPPTEPPQVHRAGGLHLGSATILLTGPSRVQICPRLRLSLLCRPSWAGCTGEPVAARGLVSGRGPRRMAWEGWSEAEGLPCKRPGKTTRVQNALEIRPGKAVRRLTA